MKTVKFYTLGCKVNQYETQVIREEFIQAGFKELQNSQPADIYLINTCTVTQSADQKSRHFIHYAYRQNPKAKIIVTGCYTELDSDKIEKIPGVAHIIKNQDKYRIPELLNGHNENNGLNEPNEIGIPNAVNQGSHASGSRRDTEAVTTFGITNFYGHTRAFLKIQDGCDNFCAYCKIPLVRGASRSRQLDDIISEAKKLVKNDFKEIVLTGICLGSYGKDLSDKTNIVSAIEALEEIEGLLRIRLSSIEALDISGGLIEKMASSAKLCRHLHIPIQSGDDEILKRMNRGYTRTDYLNLINKIRKYIPYIAITTDVLVGFPGENEINFKNTLDLVKEIMPLKVHIFPYSRREGTLVASQFKDKLNPLIIKERISQLQTVAQNCSTTYMSQFLSKVMDVLIETQHKEKPGFLEGHTDNYIKVRVESNFNLKNQLIPLKLKKIVKDSVLADFG
jgi:threonylcarbamoyladenosine tRNA methylthiotransferase MtaB